MKRAVIAVIAAVGIGGALWGAAITANAASTAISPAPTCTKHPGFRCEPTPTPTPTPCAKHPGFRCNALPTPTAQPNPTTTTVVPVLAQTGGGAPVVEVWPNPLQTVAAMLLLGMGLLTWRRRHDRV